MFNKISSESVSVEDIGHKMTMGQLLSKVEQHVSFSDESITEGFSTALKERNYLTHRFFLEKDSALGSVDGRMQVLAELVKTEANLEHCRVLINAMRIAMCRTVGIEDQWAQGYS